MGKLITLNPYIAYKMIEIIDLILVTRSVEYTSTLEAQCFQTSLYTDDNEVCNVQTKTSRQ